MSLTTPRVGRRRPAREAGVSSGALELADGKLPNKEVPLTRIARRLGGDGVTDLSRQGPRSRIAVR